MNSLQAAPQVEHDHVAFDVSPDGKRVVFSRADGNLYLLELKTRQVTTLTRSGRCTSPAFHPDGAKVVYSASVSGQTGAALYELSLAKKTARRLTADAKVSDSQPAYSPDGAWIVFVRAVRYRRYSMGGMVWSDDDLCIMQAEGTGLKPLTAKKYYSAGRPVFSRDGRSVFYSAEVPYDAELSERRSGGSLATILQVALESGEPKIVLPLPKPGKQGGANGSEPDLSPDGKRLAFLSDQAEPFRYDLCTMNLDGSDLRSLRVTKVSSYNQQPTYLPDGKSLLFLAGAETNESSRPLFSLWQVNVDGTGARELADSGLFTSPARWKPTVVPPSGVRGRSLLSVAASKGDVKTVRALLQKGANPNAPDADGSTMLARAVEKGHIDVVKLLLAKGAKVNAASTGGSMKGMPPLVLAALCNSVPVVEALLRAGADVKAVDPQMGNTALDWACGMGNIAMARLLLSKGSKVDSRNGMGGTPLMGAAMAGKLELVKFLVARGANVRARDDRARQEFGMAQFSGDRATAEKIRQSGRLNELREDGRSVLDWAMVGGNPEVVAFLKKSGATN